MIVPPLIVMLPLLVAKIALAPLAAVVTVVPVNVAEPPLTNIAALTP